VAAFGTCLSLIYQGEITGVVCKVALSILGALSSKWFDPFGLMYAGYRMKTGASIVGTYKSGHPADMRDV
jgi:hypothetical protein